MVRKLNIVFTLFAFLAACSSPQQPVATKASTATVSVSTITPVTVVVENTNIPQLTATAIPITLTPTSGPECLVSEGDSLDMVVSGQEAVGILRSGVVWEYDILCVGGDDYTILRRYPTITGLHDYVIDVTGYNIRYVIYTNNSEIVSHMYNSEHASDTNIVIRAEREAKITITRISKEEFTYSVAGKVVCVNLWGQDTGRISIPTEDQIESILCGGEGYYINILVGS